MTLIAKGDGRITTEDEALRFFRRKRHAYVQTFKREALANSIVLKDLAKFCRATESCFNADPRLHAVLEGRREVWLRIQEFLQLTDEELFELKTKKD